MMSAVLRTSFLGFHLKFASNLVVPNRPGVGEVLVKVHSAAINPVDYKLPRIANGKVVGVDFSGVVDSVGGEVGEIIPGDEVFGVVLTEGGSLAEYTLVKASRVAKKPKWLSHAEAAALPVAYSAALQGLRDHGRMMKGGSVLIIGASGGAGLAACQLANAMGASRIVAVCSGKNKDLVLSNGASEFVDYTDSRALADFFNKNKGGFDTILDCATSSGGGEDYTTSSLPLLKATGEYVQLNAPPLEMMKVMMFHMSLGPHQTFFDTLSSVQRAHLDDVVLLLSSSNFRPQITTLPFTEEDVKEGFHKLMGRRTRGKIVFVDMNSTESMRARSA